MEDLVGEENVDWGLLRRAVPFQTPTNVVEGLEHDFLELLGSRRHDVDQEACATRRDTDSVFVGLGDQDSRGRVFLHFSGWSGGRSGAAPTDVDPATTQLSSLMLTSVIPATVTASSGALPIEMELCHHVSDEGSFWSQVHQTPHCSPSRAHHPHWWATGSQFWQMKIH